MYIVDGSIIFVLRYKRTCRVDYLSPKRSKYSVFGLNYDAVFEDGGEIIFLHTIIRRISSNVLLRKIKSYKIYYSLKER